MRKTMTAIAALMLMTAAAQAWEVELDQDPMDDTVTAIMIESARSVALSFKCWQDRPDETLLMILTLNAFDESADYDERVNVAIRVDDADVRVFSVMPRNLSGRFAAATNVEADSGILDLIRDVGNAKKRIGLQFGSGVYKLGVRGSTAAMKKFAAACNLTLPEIDATE